MDSRYARLSKSFNLDGPPTTTPGQKATIIRTGAHLADIQMRRLVIPHDFESPLPSGVELELPKHLGIPLRVVGVHDTTSTITNSALWVLGLNINPTDHNFGTYDPARYLEHGNCHVVVFRGDGVDFPARQMSGLLDFLNAEATLLMRVPLMVRRQIVTVAENKRMLGTLSLEASVGFWEKPRAGKGSEGVECPVRIAEVYGEEIAERGYGTEVCGACGAQESQNGVDGGAMLLQCARCKGQRYCSRECQKKDRKAHKKLCKAA